MSATKLSHLAGILSTLPMTSGVYQMKNKTGKVIYVGKAKNLKSRVHSYFQRTSELSPAKRQMVEQIYDIELILTSTEVEALVLETNLIKHLHPKYNILMKDDKNLSYIKITNSPVPELIKTRKKIQDGGRYSGPYVWGVEMITRYLRKLFHIRNCRVKFETLNGHITVTDKAGKTLPCMDYYIGLCPGPCTLKPNALKQHEANIHRVQEFLSGRHTHIITQIESEMREYAKDLKFEKAQELKEILSGLRSLTEYQGVRDKIGGDHDTVVLYDKNNRFFIGLTQVRDGKVIGNLRYEIEQVLDMKPSEILTTFLASHYIESDPSDVGLPDTIALEISIEDEAILEYFREKKIRIDTPRSGPRHELLAFTKNQLREYAYKSELATLEQKTLTREHMIHILERLGYPVPKSGPIRFECYDISHTHGHFTVASRVVIENGKTMNSEYKKYNIKTLEKGMIDDFASHKEVMMRRTIEGLELQNFPHLIIIDGGKGQLSSAIEGILSGVQKFEEKGGVSPPLFLDPLNKSLLNTLPSFTIPASSTSETPQYLTRDLSQNFTSDSSQYLTLNTSENLIPETLKQVQGRLSPRRRGENPEDVGKGEEYNRLSSTSSDILSLTPGNGFSIDSSRQGRGENGEYDGFPPICSLAKREEEVFLPYESDPILFQKGTPELMIIQKARDESHRFSITANRRARTKAMKKNLLEELPGFGPITRRKLLKLAGSVAGIASISGEQLHNLCTRSQIQTLRDHGIIE